MKTFKTYTKVLFYSKWDDVNKWQKVFSDKNIKLIEWTDNSKKYTTNRDINYAILWDPPNKLFESFPNLKLIQSLGAGVDHILSKNYPKQCIITRLEDPDLTNQMTEYALMSAFMCYRRYFKYRGLKDKSIWSQLPALKTKEFKITILGYGNIAKNIAKELIRFGFSVNIWANKQRIIKKCNYFYGPKQLIKSIHKSNCILNLLPNTSKTIGLINLSLFKKLAKEAYFINIGRGNTVNEADLIYALKNDIITGAILDVFKNEPLNKTNALWKLQNTFITPHIAGITNATDYAANTFLKNINNINNELKITNRISVKKEY